MKIKLKKSATELKAIGTSCCEIDLNNIYKTPPSKYRTIAVVEAQKLLKKVLVHMLNCQTEQLKTISLSPFEAFILEQMLREVLNSDVADDDYTKNTLLMAANELDQQLINLTT